MIFHPRVLIQNKNDVLFLEFQLSQYRFLCIIFLVVIYCTFYAKLKIYFCQLFLALPAFPYKFLYVPAFPYISWGAVGLGGWGLGADGARSTERRVPRTRILGAI